MAILITAGTFLLKFIILVLVLGVIILVHEFGHFICAKKFGVHIYEFSIGMGPILHTHKGKDKIDYNIRAVPIGGFVSMAGEVYDDDDKIPKKKLMCNKPWWQRTIILVAGVFNNFVLAIVLLSVYCAIWGGSPIEPKIANVTSGSAAERDGLKAGDIITNINGYKVSSWDKAQVMLYYKNDKDYYIFTVKHNNGIEENITITPDVVKDDDGTESKVFGISVAKYEINNFLSPVVYGFKKFGSLISSMWSTLTGLITGKIALNALSGPVGIFEVVGSSVGMKLSAAIAYIIYIIAYLSINVGLINILPFPAFDGGHVLFILIELIRRKPVDSKIENACHMIGFILILLLMLVVTFNDILKLF